MSWTAFHYKTCAIDGCDECNNLTEFLSGCEGCGMVGQNEAGWNYRFSTGGCYCDHCWGELTKAEQDEPYPDFMTKSIDYPPVKPNPLNAGDGDW